MPRRRPSTARSPVAIAHPKRTTRRLTTAGRVGATIGTIPHLVPVTPGKDCVVSGSGTAKGRRLGCGDQACVYELKNRLTVVKITPLITDAVEARWVREFQLAKQFGDNKIGPTIRKGYTCNGRGYIEMDRVSNAKTLPGGTILRTEVKTRVVGETKRVDRVDRMPEQTQLQFIHLFEQMIAKGYIHMDNHLGNMGFVDGERPVLFDFEFTQKRIFSKQDAVIALAFSIYQVIEDTSFAHLKNTLFWKQACALTASLHASTPLSMQASRKTHGDNWDLYVGCAAYDTLLRKSPSKRYNDPAFDVIYDIRQGLSPYGPPQSV